MELSLWLVKNWITCSWICCMFCYLWVLIPLFSSHILLKSFCSYSVLVQYIFCFLGFLVRKVLLAFWFCIGFMILMYFFETYLDTRQHSALKLPTLPKTLEGVISQEKFEKSRAYSLEKRYILVAFLIDTTFEHIRGFWFADVSFVTRSHFHFVHEFVTILMDSAILFFRVLPWFWKVSNWFQANFFAAIL